MPPNTTVRLLIVDDHPLFRQGLRFALTVYDDISIVYETASGEDAIDWLNATSPNQEPNCVLCDLNLPVLSGLDVTRQLRSLYPSLGVVILSMHENDEQAFNALQAGAAAYRSKDIKPKDLAEIVRRVARGEYVINDVVLEEPKVASRLLSQFRNLPQDVSSTPDADFPLFTPLSDREIEVLERIAEGGSNKEIADTLGISTQTVKNHISSILRKLSLNDRTQAVIYALRRGWIETPEAIMREPRASASKAEDAE
ncbi:MAG: response regulator transcription factor [Roseiflexaceae bacterium]|nr:response regulator transcription factor [Roseiflexaceae bacterium]